MMTQRQWQEVEAIVRREQQRALQHMNMVYYKELGEILDHLLDPAHCEPSALSCKDHLTDE